jgi:hypothetical protein
MLVRKRRRAEAHSPHLIVMGERNAAAINARAPASGAPCTASPDRSSDLDGIHAPVGALTADQLSLNESHAQPAGGSRSGTVLDGRAAAQHDDVEFAHVGIS